MKWWHVVIIIVIILALVLVYNLCRISDRYLKRTSVALGPGDIVAVGSSGSGFRMFVQSHWTHVGLVLPTSTGLVMVEMNSYRNPDQPRKIDRGFWALPLAEWWQRNHYREVAVAKYTGKPFDPVEVERLIEAHRNVRMEPVTLRLLRYLQLRPYRPGRGVPTKSMCAGLTMRFLQELGRATKQYEPTCYDSPDLLYGRFRTIECSYAPPQRIDLGRG